MDSDKSEGSASDEPHGGGNQPPRPSHPSPGGAAACDSATSPDGTCPFPAAASASAGGTCRFVPRRNRGPAANFVQRQVAGAANTQYPHQDGDDTDSFHLSTLFDTGAWQEELERFMEATSQKEVGMGHRHRPRQKRRQGAADGNDRLLPLVPQQDPDDSDSSASSGSYPLQQAGDGSDRMLPLVPQPLDDSDLSSHTISDASDTQQSADESDQMLSLVPQLDSDDSDSSASSGGDAGTCNLQPAGDGGEQMMPLVPQLDLDDSVQQYGSDQMSPLVPELDDSDLTQYTISDISGVQQYGSDQMSPLVPEPDDSDLSQYTISDISGVQQYGSDQMSPLVPEPDDSDLSQYTISDISGVQQYGDASDQMIRLVPELDSDDSVQQYGSDQMSPLVPEPDDSDLSQYTISDISGVQQYGDASDQMIRLVPELDSDDSVQQYGSDQMSPLVPEPDDSDLSQYTISDISGVDAQQRRFRSELYIPPRRARRPSAPARIEGTSRSTAASPPSQHLVPVHPRAHVPQDTFAADQHLPAARVPFIPRTMDMLDILPQPIPGATSADHGRKHPEDYKVLRRRERSPRKRPSVPAGAGYEASVGRRVQASVGLGALSIDPNVLAVSLVASSQDQDDDPFKVPCRRKKVPRLSGSGRSSRMRRQSGSGIRRPAMRRAARRPDVNARNVPAPLETSLALLPHSPTAKAGTRPIASAGNSLQRWRAEASFAPFNPNAPVDLTLNYRPLAAAYVMPSAPGSDDSPCNLPRQRTGRRRSSRRGLPTPPRPGLRALGMEPPHEDEPHRRVIGEIAFQLDRRILSYIFNTGIRMYGFRVLNIPEKINQVSTCATDRDEMSNRYRGIMQQLGNFGYCAQKHPKFAESIVNTFGILKEKPQCPTMLANYNDPEYLKKTIHENAPLSLVLDLMVLLNCLSHMSVNDGRPLFIW